ncbi:response regulator transcription factor [Chloroflexota bacterium]
MGLDKRFSIKYYSTYIDTKEDIMDIQYKVDINPSYEWSEKAKELNISHRELEVLALVVEGYKNKEIAKILKIQHQSVKNHLQHLFKKLDVKNSTQAYIIAMNLNMMKMRGKIKDTVVDIDGEMLIDDFRKSIGGELRISGVKPKDIRRMKVFLKEHGIDPYNW